MRSPSRTCHHLMGSPRPWLRERARLFIKLLLCRHHHRFLEASWLVADIQPPCPRLPAPLNEQLRRSLPRQAPRPVRHLLLQRLQRVLPHGALVAFVLLLRSPFILSAACCAPSRMPASCRRCARPTRRAAARWSKCSTRPSPSASRSSAPGPSPTGPSSGTPCRRAAAPHRPSLTAEGFLLESAPLPR